MAIRRAKKSTVEGKKQTEAEQIQDKEENIVLVKDAETAQEANTFLDAFGNFDFEDYNYSSAKVVEGKELNRAPFKLKSSITKDDDDVFKNQGILTKLNS